MEVPFAESIFNLYYENVKIVLEVKKMSLRYLNVTYLNKNLEVILDFKDKRQENWLHKFARCHGSLGEYDLQDLFYPMLLFSKKRHLSKKNKRGDTPLHVAADYSYDRTVCKFIFPTLLNRALTLGCKMNCKNRKGYNLLHLSVASPYTYLIEDGTEVDESSYKRLLKLHSEGVDVGLNDSSEEGMTPLMIALDNDNFAVAEELIRHGAVIHEFPAFYGWFYLYEAEEYEEFDREYKTYRRDNIKRLIKMMNLLYLEL